MKFVERWINFTNKLNEEGDFAKKTLTRLALGSAAIGGVLIGVGVAESIPSLSELGIGFEALALFSGSQGLQIKYDWPPGSDELHQPSE